MTDKKKYSSIPFLDLKQQVSAIKDEVLKVIEDVYSNCAFTNGPYVEEFEKNFARYCEAKHVIAVNSGTSALHLALRVFDIDQGDEIIIPANTFIATAWAAKYVNATPVFVDCNPDTWEIDPIDVKRKITRKTKAIIGVHLYGQPFDIDAIKEIADKNKLILIEDAAQAHGARYKGRKIGGISDITCFSFYPGKNLGTFGEGGAITTNNYDYYERLVRLRNHASVDKYYHNEVGYNMRMGGTEGAVLNIKLNYIDNWTKRRQQIAKKYQEEITNSKIKKQSHTEISESVYHLFVVTTDNRNNFMNYLKDNNIFAGMHYPVSCHLQKAFSSLGYKKGDIPNAEYLADCCVSLPMFPELTDEQVNRVISVVNNY